MSMADGSFGLRTGRSIGIGYGKRWLAIFRVGQVVNLRPIVNRPVLEFTWSSDRPIFNRRQDTILPYVSHRLGAVFHARDLL